MTPHDKALKLCQDIAMTTFGDKEFNEGSTLPLHVVKKIAIICVDEILKTVPLYSEVPNYEYWNEVRQSISKL